MMPTSAKRALLDEHLEAYGAGALTLAKLRKLWKSEYNAHRNMLCREGGGTRVVSEAHRTFPAFLADVGPCPAHGYTLDRIDNSDPEYAPGKVRWASKRTQANNRSNTRMITVQGRGQVPVTDAAKFFGINPDTLRKRLDRGMTDSQALGIPEATPTLPVVEAPNYTKKFAAMTWQELLDYKPWSDLNADPELDNCHNNYLLDKYNEYVANYYAEDELKFIAMEGLNRSNCPPQYKYIPNKYRRCILNEKITPLHVIRDHLMPLRLEYIEHLRKYRNSATCTPDKIASLAGQLADLEHTIWHVSLLANPFFKRWNWHEEHAWQRRAADKARAARYDDGDGENDDD
jgi:hypothetical protein